ncbi:MAG: P-loop NTPase fold protein [bacterium]
MAQKIIRNENAPFYFEILLAGVEFLNLLEKDSFVTKIQIKPDRKYGQKRRIEDLTKFYKNVQVEVIQIKHTLRPESKLGFGDLWITNLHQTNTRQSCRKEGTNIFKFLKSWRVHKKQNKSVRLTIASNKILTNELFDFLRDIKKLREKKLSWKSFHNRHNSEIKSIKANCNASPFVNNKELKSFLSALHFKEIPAIDVLEKELRMKLKREGVVDNERGDAFITRITRLFVSNEIEVTPQKVIEFIDRLETGLIQEIATPLNYIDRPNLETKILQAIEAKKKRGGFVLLFAPSGSGKTVLLSHLAEKNTDFFPYFCRIRPFEAVKGKSGYSNNNRLKSSWFKTDIIQRCYEFGLLDKTIGIKDDENFIDKTFDEALKKLSDNALKRHSKKIVIIIDALDQVETDNYRDKSVLDAIPSVNYPGIVFLLSTWGERYLPKSIRNLTPNTKKETGINLYFTEKEIERYFKQADIPLNRDQIAIIKKKTNGLAISLFYLSRKLKQSGTPDNIIRSPSQYTEVFDWYRPIWDSLSKKEKECFGYLCFHFASVKREDLQQLMYYRQLNITTFNDLLKKVDHFLHLSGGFIEPYHDSFRRFVIAQIMRDKKSYHRILGKYYSKNALSLYGKKYIIKHLEVVGIKDSSVKTIFQKLHQTGFFNKILRSNIDEPTKVEIGRSFVNYFYHVQNVEQLVHYAILTSNIYSITHDEDVFQKAQIGTEKLISEVEKELLLPKINQPWYQREWVFKRLAVGNILIEKADKNCIDLARRFIDDSLFRINLNPELLWSKDANDEFWNNVEVLTRALVNAHQYKKALDFVKKGISFQKPSLRLEGGFKGIKLTKIHLQNLKINNKETLKTISKSSKIERLLIYLEKEKNGLKISDNWDFRRLLNDEKVERFLYDNKHESQRLDFAEALFIHGAKNFKKRTQKLLNKVEIELPYCNRGYTDWGGPERTRELFLKWIALKGLIDKKFNLKEFYIDSLKEKFSRARDYSEYENPEFLNVLSIECDLEKNRLLLQARKITWEGFWKVLENSLRLYKQKIDQINPNEDNNYETRKNLYPYSHDLLDLIRDNLQIISVRFPNKTLSFLNKIENILGIAYINKRADILEKLIEVSVPTTIIIKEKLESYLGKTFEIRQKERLDNLSKSSNLQNLAVIAAQKGFLIMADNIFIKSLKYSRGLWSKEDFRFNNLVDCLRTQKSEQFKLILRYIERVSDIIEGAGYLRLDFLESATYEDFRMALDYLYKFIVEGKVNQNEALRRVISTYIKRYHYHTIKDILPLLGLMHIKEENSYEYFENITKVYFKLCGWALINNDYQRAEELMMRYFEILKKYIEPTDRINLLQDIILFITPYSQLKSIRRDVEFYLAALRQEGYSAAMKKSPEFKVTYDSIDIEKLKTSAKKGRIKSVLKTLDQYTKQKNYFTDRLVAELVPFLSYADLQHVREWAVSNKINIEGAELFSTLIRKTVATSNQSLLAKTQSDVFRAINNSEHNYEIHGIIKALDKIDFPNKQAFIRKLLLAGIRRLAGDSYSLPQFFTYASKYIDKYFIDIKKFSFASWKNIVETSMSLSLSKK